LVRGIYAAASGALVAQSLADNVANNLANVNSSGFKQTLLQVQSAPSLDVYRIQTDPGQASGSATPGVPTATYVGPLGTGSLIYDTPEDFAQGPLQETGNRLDVALTGANQFFTIQTPNGIRYTRDGQFTTDANGTLLTTDGNYVLGTTGRAIVVNPQQGPVTINPDGTVTQAPQPGQTAAAATQIGTLQITSFGNLVALRKEGDNNFFDSGTAAPAATPNVSVRQGFLEKGNGNVVRAMVDLITAERWFDANQRAIKAQDDATAQAITNVAKANG
jgi:flagellar basal-body rod protein FlgF